MTGSAGDGPDTAGTVVWRTGRKVPIHLYRQLGPEPSETDPPIGTMLTAEDAALAVAAVRAHQNIIGQQTAARALRDAAAFTAEFWGQPVGIHIADWLRARADTLDTPTDDAP